MNVWIKGNIRNKKLIYRYVDILLKALKLDHLDRDLFIDFVQECDAQTHALGFAWGDKDQVEIEISRSHYHKKLTFLEMMKTLTHEMVHARQFFRGRLKYRGFHAIWKGEHMGVYDNKNSPWEKEAYDLEEKLFNKWFPIDEPFRN